MGYESYKADLDLWLKPEIIPEDGVEDYSYLLCYVEEFYASIIMQIPCWNGLHSFPLKLGFGNPDIYVGAKLCKSRLHNGVWAWAMSSTKYVQEAVRNCRVHLLVNT